MQDREDTEGERPHKSDLVDQATQKDGTMPEKMDLDIVYEDDAVMVINKPANMVVHPGIGNYTGTLLNGVSYHLLAQNPNLNEEVLPRFGLVHRIDKNTTGLIVLAKTAEAASHLAKQSTIRWVR